MSMRKRLRRVSVVKVAAALAVILLIYPVTIHIVRACVRAETIASPSLRSLSPETGDIGLEDGLVEIAREGGYRVAIDTQTLDVQITDEAAGRTFHSLYTDPAAPAAAKSPLTIRFLSKDQTSYEWDAYTNSISNQWYSLKRIKNGVRIQFDFQETDIYRLYEYIPRYISVDRYEEIFAGRLAALTEQGAVTAEQSALYSRALKAFYAKDATKGYYYSKSSGLPPASVVKSLVEFTKAIHYTSEELVEDNDMYGIATEFKEPAAFTVYMEITFQNGELAVNIPVYEQKNGNDFYTLQRISVFPAFDCRAEEENDGYIFVPDGAGMLIAMDSFNGAYPAYSRAVYGNDLFETKFQKSDFEEPVTMPVFGLYGLDEQGRSSGFLAVIDSGAELADISVSLKSGAGDGSGGLYNAVYASADTMQYSMVNLYGPYAEDKASHLETTGPIDFDFTVRYRFYTQDASYYAFARDYRQQLIDAYGLDVSYDDRPKLFLQMAGAFTVWDKFMGIPYDATVSMTTYRQALEILNDLQGIPLVANYQYGLNGGRMNTVGNKADLVAANGSRADLEELLARSSPGNEVFMEASLMRVYRKGTLFNDKRFYLTGFGGASDWRSAFNDMWSPDGSFYTPYEYSLYYLIHPRYLSAVVDGFLKDAEAYPNIALTDFGNQFYGNYRDGDVVDPVRANRGVVLPNLEKLASRKTLALDNPNADKLAYAAYSLNVSRESSDYGVSYTSVPFRQLVMNGLTEYTTLDVNGGWSSPETFLLQALELGSIPKFSVFAEKPDILMEARISAYTASNYDTVSPAIRELYETYRQAFAEIGTKEIAGHETFAPGVHMTTYRGGVRVLVNYNAYGVTVGSREVEPYGYAILPAEAMP